MEFTQCPVRQGTNVKCNPVTTIRGKDSTNYCSKHLVKPDAPVKYMNQNGEVVEQ